MTVHSAYKHSKGNHTASHTIPQYSTAQHKGNSFENDRQLFNDDDDIGIVSFVALLAHEKLVFKRIFSIILYTLDCMRNERERVWEKTASQLNWIESNRIIPNWNQFSRRLRLASVIQNRYSISFRLCSDSHAHDGIHFSRIDSIDAIQLCSWVFSERWIGETIIDALNSKENYFKNCIGQPFAS